MISLFYKKIMLGTLYFDYKTNEFIYNSKVKNEKEAKEKYKAMDFYNLFNSENKRQKDLFDDFKDFSDALEREDIIKLAQIKEEDSLFVKLEKLASLDLLEDGFYIKKI